MSTVKNQIDFDKFNEYVNNELKLSPNAGLAVSVISDKGVLFEKGFGYRDIPNKKPFSPETIFPIASHTKSFTATAIAMLVDDGIITWDTPIRDLIPEFRLNDLFASERCNLRDLLSHTTGLPHHQFVYMNGEWKYKDIFKRLPYLKPVYDFRVQHKYSNLNFIAATRLVEELSGKNYFDFITERIFKPLKMNDTNFSITEVFEKENFTYGYKESEDDYILEKYLDLKMGSAGAGSINSNLVDLCKWIQFHLNKGKIADKQIISKKILNDLYTMQKLDRNPLEILFPGKNYIRNYGFALGWWVFDYRGVKINQHYGTGPGIMFNGGFLPDNNLGFVIFSNTSGSNLPIYLNFHLVDQLLGLDIVKWGDEIRSWEAKQEEMVTKKNLEEDKVKKELIKPSHPLEDFVGIYQHPGYGKLEFSLKNNQLSASYGKDSKVSIDHFNYDVFIIKIEHLGGFGISKFVTFRADFQGKITHLEIDAEPLLKPTIFEKIAWVIFSLLFFIFHIFLS
ncbi:MAG: serine hydrolase [Candidatus Heimdallarchaeota archaeon]|nr:serine hydrolase [Candidatus Heimdallarchaeota archaeon]